MVGFDNKFVAVLACGLWLVSCSKGEADSMSPSHGDDRWTPGGGSEDGRPRGLVVEPRRGGSSIVPDAAKITLTVSCPHGGACFDDPSATASLLAQKILLTHGEEVIGVVPEELPSVQGSPGKDQPATRLLSNEYTLSFLPAEHLQADTKYTMSIVSDSSVVMGFVDSTVAEASAALAAEAAFAETINIFTGSVPLLAATELANDPAKALTQVRIRMSEPISLSSAIDNIKLFRADQQLVPTCVWDAQAARCADAESTLLSAVIDLSFASATAVSDVTGGYLEVSGGIRGTSNTLADGLPKIGRTLDATGLLRVELDGMWDVCSPSGDTLCIRDLGQF